jgi:diphthine synthase
MLYLIGLGLNKEGFSYEAINAIKNCRKIYLENYTVEFPYTKDDIQELIQKKILEADRSFVESDNLIKEAKEQNVALLIYGAPLMATTHISLIELAKKSGISTRIIHSASVLDAVAETGLQTYKFGKITSMPKFQKNFEPTSFIEVLKQNQSIEAHSLILVDIGLNLKDALNQLKKSCKKENFKLDKIVLCERLGMKDFKIYYGTIEKLNKKQIKAPFCIIMPSKLHFLEKEILERFSI